MEVQITIRALGKRPRRQNTTDHGPTARTGSHRRRRLDPGGPHPSRTSGSTSVPGEVGASRRIRGDGRDGGSGRRARAPGGDGPTRPPSSDRGCVLRTGPRSARLHHHRRLPHGRPAGRAPRRRRRRDGGLGAGRTSSRARVRPRSHRAGCAPAAPATVHDEVGVGNRPEYTGIRTRWVPITNSQTVSAAKARRSAPPGPSAPLYPWW